MQLRGTEFEWAAGLHRLWKQYDRCCYLYFKHFFNRFILMIRMVKMNIIFDNSNTFLWKDLNKLCDTLDQLQEFHL